ncbi:hypothetical protein R3P38DRAFT_3332074 [Favolaschia claudopus]|uniref:DUF6589 domain-containing protein n=1 Tax=Favolaschia claudopus TaxID=2862362 RepID=A0AAV9Z7Y5_9AGAR
MESSPDENRPKRPYRRLPQLTIPTIPSYGPDSASSSVSPTTPFTPSSATSSTQQSLRNPKRTKWQKVNDVLSKYGFRSLGDFLETLFYCHAGNEEDPRTPKHIAAVTSFLQGSSNVKMANIIQLIYSHPQSRAKLIYPDQVDAAFSSEIPLDDIRFARPCLNAWAVRVVGDELHRRVGRLAEKKNDLDGQRHIRATSNGRKEGVRTMTWDDTHFTMQDLAARYRAADPLLWYITECCCAPRVKGNIVVRERRPHPPIQVAAISSFIVSRNSYASGELALPLAVWHFSCGSHVDVKRVYCRLAGITSTSTTYKALNSMSAADMKVLQQKTQAGAERGEAAFGKIVDNVQYHDVIHEHGLGRENTMKVGTACTTFEFFDPQPGAFDAQDHVNRVCRQDRQNMTTESVYRSIDWNHNLGITNLHSVRVLAEFSPHLSHLRTAISARFRTTYAKYRIPVHKTILQPLGTNSERETTTQGMQQALKDFDKQMGIEPEKSDNILQWVRGDGASHATTLGLKKYLSTSLNIYDSCRNIISTPETWHTKATDLNACASNHYGPAASKDPSSLSRSSNAANMKRPTNLKKCNFYPTSRSMTLIWEAQVLDCWRVVLGVEDLYEHFERLAETNSLPTLDELLVQASILRRRYASQTAYNESLSSSEYEAAKAEDRAPRGSTLASPSSNPNPSPPSPEPEVDADMPADGEEDSHPAPEVQTEVDAQASPLPSKNEPKTFVEEADFDGDRVLSNSILFIMEFGWWIELNYAIPEGDVGRVLEILKIFIFTFAGTAHQNYMRYMLDLYALLEFECSPALKKTLLNNYLLNLRGEVGTFVEGDLVQEWNIKWLTGMIKRKGGEFDEPFYRNTIAPNVLHFIKIKEDMESAFELTRRSKSHTSPHMRDETRMLLKLYKEDQLHSFRSGRSLGHAAVNRFERGYEELQGGKLGDYLERSAEQLRSLGRAFPPAEGTDNNADQPSQPEPTMEEEHPRTGSPSSFPPASSSSSRSPSALSSNSRESSSSSSSSESEGDGSPHNSNADNSDEHDPSNEELTSGSDLTVTVDNETGGMSTEWYEEEEFEEVLRNLGDDDEISEEEEDPEVPQDDIDYED